MNKSSLHFPVDQDLPKPLVEKLVAARLAEIERRGRWRQKSGRAV